MQPHAPDTSTEPVARTHTFEFTGSGGEYFRIWIVNILLTLLTLGIYSAWATVRTKRYLYGNTRVMGSGFEFHAAPMTILKGRLLVVAVLACVILLGSINPAFQGLAIVALFPLVPFLIVRSRVFNAVNSSWRNVRFNFDRNYGESYKVYMFWPMLTPFTLGLLAPYVSYRRNRFLVTNSALGRQHFSFHSEIGGFYARMFGVFFLGVGVVVVMALIMGGLMAAAQFGAAGAEGTSEPGPMAGPVTAGAVVLFYLALGMVGITARVVILNYVWSGVGIGDARMSSELGIGGMIWITLSNLLLVVLTLGLFTPWAVTRMARYRAQRTNVTADEQTVNALTAAEQQGASAIGDEAIDVFGVEVGAI